jgi:hypothetical protein
MSDHGVKAAAARAGVSAEEYLKRTRRGELYCYRCRGWHDSSEFGPDRRRPSGKATSCSRSVSAARLEMLRREIGDLADQQAASRQQQHGPAAPAADQWVAIVRQLPPEPRDQRRGTYWTGANGHDDGDWTTSLDDAARFPTIEALRDALIAAYGGPGNVPSGCHLARFSQ